MKSEKRSRRASKPATRATVQVALSIALSFCSLSHLQQRRPIAVAADRELYLGQRDASLNAVALAGGAHKQLAESALLASEPAGVNQRGTGQNST